MAKEPTKEELDKLAKEFGLDKSNFEFKLFDNPLFHGDFGHSINLGFLVTVLFLILVSIFLIIYKKKQRK